MFISFKRLKETNQRKISRSEKIFNKKMHCLKNLSQETHNFLQKSFRSVFIVMLFAYTFLLTYSVVTKIVTGTTIT